MIFPNLLIVVLGFLAIALGMLYLFREFLHLYWKRYKVPFVPLKFPNILSNISRGKHQALQLADFYKHHRTDQPVIGFYMFLKPTLMIVDPGLIRSILINNFEYFQNRVMYHNKKNDPLSGNLGSMVHDQWKPLKEKLSKRYTRVKIKQMFNSTRNVEHVFVSGLTEIIQMSDTVEMRDVLSQLTTDIMVDIIGIQSKVAIEQLREMVRKSMQPYLTFPFLNTLTTAFPEVSRFLGIRKHKKGVSDFFAKVFEETIQYREESGEKRDDYMQFLIDTGLDKKQIIALAYDLLSAGCSDSTSTLAYCLYELALEKNKYIQDEARNEIQLVLEQHNGDLTYDVLGEMSYVKQIINETLRLHALAGNATRIATKSYKVPNTDFTIPTGMCVYIPIYAIHHDEQHYHDPEEFIPERFAQKPKSGVYLPFGDGPRACIGFRFAQHLISIGLVYLLQHFEFSTCDRTQIPIQYSATKNTLIPSDGVWLKVKRI